MNYTTSRTYDTSWAIVGESSRSVLSCNEEGKEETPKIRCTEDADTQLYGRRTFRTVISKPEMSSAESSLASDLADSGRGSHARQARLSVRRQKKQARSSSLQTVLLASLFLFLTCVRSTMASEGDRSPEYTACVDSCNLDSCLVPPTWSDGMADATRLPVMLRITFWTCLDDCRYHCTHRVTNEAHERVTHVRQESQSLVEREAQANGWSRAQQRQKVNELVQLRLASLRRVQKQMVQYHGKWVFIRMFGAQEPLSVLFSFANLFVHLTALDMLRRQVPDAFPLKMIYVLHALLSCSAWFWSAVFHTRDKAFTERMDYFGAGAVVLGGLFIAMCRLWRLAPGSWAFKALARMCGAAYLLHVLYLSFGRFDYAYNMKANITVGVLHSLLWLAYSVRPALFSEQSVGDGAIGRLRIAPHVVGNGTSPHATPNNGGSPPVPVSTPPPVAPSSSRKARRQLQLILALLWLASALEVFDFPPVWRALDAHALWHLATVPIARMWYVWLIEDARECTSSGFWIGAKLNAKLTEYLPLPHQTEVAVENVTRAVGPPVMRAVEKARELLESAAGRSSNGLNDVGQSSGIEFKALTTKLNDFARSTLGNGSSAGSSSQQQQHIVSSATNAHHLNGRTHAHARTGSAFLASGASNGRVVQSEREREKRKELGHRSGMSNGSSG